MSPAPKRRSTASSRSEPSTQPQLPWSDPAAAFDHAVAPVTNLDDIARRYPARKITVEPRKRLEFFSKPEAPNAFAMDSLEFFFQIAQYFREALPLRMIFLLIACQRAGGRIHLTQEEMADVLDVTRQKVCEVLVELMEFGIVYRVKRGVYQFNPPFSYRVAEFIPATDGTEPQYIKVEQHEVIELIRGDKGLAEHVRFPNLDAMRAEVERVRAVRAEKRKLRREEREQQKQQERD